MIHIHNRKMSNAIWQEALLHLTHLVTQELHKGRRVLLFLSGGSAVQLYKKLGESLLRNEIDSSYIAFAQVDERFQPEDKNDVNAVSIERTGLWEVCKKKNIPYYLISQEGTLEDSARQYNETVSKLLTEYPYRLAILGIGEDGHTAGLLPFHERYWNKKPMVVGYTVKERQNNTAVSFCQRFRFKKRVTLTPKALKLNFALVVASGEKKRWAIENAFKKENKNSIDIYPAALLQKIQKVDLFTDIHLPDLLQ